MNEQEMLSVLAPVRYPWRFNGPRRSRHSIENRCFLPFDRASAKLEGITIFNPMPPRHFDLIHAFNRIPISSLPFVIGFESRLPRGYGFKSISYMERLRHILESDRCRAIIAMSEFSRRLFLKAHRGSPDFGRLEAKLQMRYPNLPIPARDDRLAEEKLDQIQLVFVGNHFGRKGGCVAVKVAEMALRQGFPLRVTVVSTLERSIWNDPPDPDFFKPYYSLLDLRNVTLHRGLPNNEVMAMLGSSHMSVLTTFSETFGYSAIESMAHHVPVIATRVGALAEFISDGDSGILVDLSVDEDCEWVVLKTMDRNTAQFATLYRDEIQRMAETAFAAIVDLHAHPERLFEMRRRSREVAIKLFSADDANRYWDNLYDMAATGVVSGTTGEIH
jgi:glycosyltransferase involved in cell wall biosynthesis